MGDFTGFTFGDWHSSSPEVGDIVVRVSDGDRYEEPYICDEYRSGRLNAFGPYTVSAGGYFVMGDHRNNSNDSRSQGAISRDMIIGHVRSVLYPFGGVRGIE